MTKQVKTLLIVGSVLTFLSPIVGLLCVTGGMFQAFQSLGNDGIGDPKQLSNSIGLTLIGTAVGTGLGVVGVIILCVTGGIAFFSKPKLPDDQ